MRNGAPPSSRQDAGPPGTLREWLLNLLTFGRKRRRRRYDIYLLR